MLYDMSYNYSHIPLHHPRRKRKRKQKQKQKKQKIKLKKLDQKKRISN